MIVFFNNHTTPGGQTNGVIISKLLVSKKLIFLVTCMEGGFSYNIGGNFIIIDYLICNFYQNIVLSFSLIYLKCLKTFIKIF